MEIDQCYDKKVLEFARSTGRFVKIRMIVRMTRICLVYGFVQLTDMSLNEIGQCKS